MAKSWALGFAACHKQELFVAQKLITKLKSKYCGIKAYLFLRTNLINHRYELDNLIIGRIV